MRVKRGESVSERQKALVRTALARAPRTRREIAAETRIWYNDVDKAIRQMKRDGEIAVIAEGAGTFGKAELLALAEA